MKYLNASVVLTAFLLSSGICFSQEQQTKVSDDEVLSSSLKEQLPPLENLINIALKNSPLLMQGDALIQKNHEHIRLAKRDWHNNVSAFINYSVGNQRFGIPGPTGEFHNSFLNGYRAGLNVSLPLSLITNRRTQIRIAEADLMIAEQEKQQAEVFVRNQVTEQYYTLLSAQHILEIKSLSRENAGMKYQMAERKFSEGTLSLEEYTNIGISYSSSETDFESAKSAYLIQYRQFEQLLGVSLENLRARK